MRRVIAFLFAAALIAAVPANAQDKKVDVNIGGGYTFSLSEVRKHLGDGYNIGLGVTINITPTVGIQAEYAFNGLGKKQVDITPTRPTDIKAIYADMNMQYGDFNLVFKAPARTQAGAAAPEPA